MSYPETTTARTIKRVKAADKNTSPSKSFLQIRKRKVVLLMQDLVSN